MMHLMSGRAAWMAECSMNPATLTPKLVEPLSTMLPCMSTLTSEEAVTSWYSMPKGLSRKCSVSWLMRACEGEKEGGGEA